jgi:hypothetical protein
MCPPIIGLVLSVVGSLASAAMQAGIAKQQAQIEQQQLQVEMENERIKAIGDTNDRLEQLRVSESTNRAALSASGLDENVSYAQGIYGYNKRVATNDVARLDFNSGQILGRKKYEIEVAGWKAKTAAKTAFVEAGASILGDIGTFAANRGRTSGYTVTTASPA